MLMGIFPVRFANDYNVSRIVIYLWIAMDEAFVAFEICEVPIL